MAIYSVSKAAASKSLFKNYINAIIAIFLCVFFFLMPTISFLGISERTSIGTIVIAVFLLGTMIVLITAAIYGYRMHAELARLSGSSLFLWAFWINVVSVILCLSVFGIFVGFAGFITFAGFADFIIFAGFVGLIIAWVIHFIAWWRFKKLEKR